MQRILMIDDDPALGAAAKLVLEREGFAVSIVDNGEAGLKAFATAPFAAVIVNIVMRGMDGFAAIKAFRDLDRSVPLIALSGFMDLYAFRDTPERGPHMLSMATALGAVKSLSKPLRPHDLLCAVRDSLCIAV